MKDKATLIGKPFPWPYKIIKRKGFEEIVPLSKEEIHILIEECLKKKV